MFVTDHEINKLALNLYVFISLLSTIHMLTFPDNIILQFAKSDEV